MNKLGWLEEEVFNNKQDSCGEVKIDIYNTREEYYKAKILNKKSANIYSLSFDYITFADIDENPLKLGGWQDRYFIQMIAYKTNSNDDYVRLIAFNRGDNDDVYICSRNSVGEWSEWYKLSKKRYTHYLTIRSSTSEVFTVSTTITCERKEPFTNTAIEDFIKTNFSVTDTQGQRYNVLNANGVLERSLATGLCYSITTNQFAFKAMGESSGHFTHFITKVPGLIVVRDIVI